MFLEEKPSVLGMWLLVSRRPDLVDTVVDSIQLEAPKTSAISKMVTTLAPNQSCLIAIDRHDPVVWKSCRNIQRLSVFPCDDLNALSVLSRKRFVITKAALSRLLAR